MGDHRSTVTGFTVKVLEAKGGSNTSQFNHVASLEFLLSARHFGAVYSLILVFLPAVAEEISVFSMVDRGSGCLGANQRLNRTVAI